jgi:hypothetical protein
MTLSGRGIDVSGADDSTSGIQARIDSAPDGAVITIPAGAVLRCTGTLTLDRAGMTLRGPGELRFDEGPSDGTAIRITGPGSRLHQVTITNPKEIYSRGVEIAAHGVTVSDSVVDRFRYGVVVAADGEWGDTRILGNRVSNVLGSGGGRGSDSRAGEDTGDGITVWGARATISGNVVSALPGTDARIGIHAEGLGPVKRDPIPHSDAMVTVTANVVTGPFRRAIAFEEIDNGVMSANTVADGSWWGLAVINGTGCLVTDNTIRFTRSAQDDQGRAYSPSRSGIMVFGGAGHTVADNTITVHHSADAFITLSTLLDARPTDVHVTGNNCRALADAGCGWGVLMAGAPGPLRPKIRGNTFVGVDSGGVYLAAGGSPEISGNSIIGKPGCPHGILGDRAASDGALVIGNRVVSCRTGIALFGQAGGIVSSNIIEDSPTAVDLFESSGISIVGNLFTDSWTQVANLGDNRMLP